MVSANGGAAVMAIIEELTPLACRLRSINAFQLGDVLTFDFTMRGVPRLPLSGRIVSTGLNGARRSYTLALEGTDRDAIIVALDAAQRYAAAQPVRDVQTGNGLTRASARIPVDIAIEYRVEGRPARTARATNISAGGILMNTADDIAVGATLELRFVLPGSTTEAVIRSRVVAHQNQTPNYNMAFFGVDPAVRAELERFVAANS